MSERSAEEVTADQLKKRKLQEIITVELGRPDRAMSSLGGRDSGGWLRLLVLSLLALTISGHDHVSPIT